MNTDQSFKGLITEVTIQQVPSMTGMGLRPEPTLQGAGCVVLLGWKCRRVLWVMEGERKDNRWGREGASKRGWFSEWEDLDQTLSLPEGMTGGFPHFRSLWAKRPLPTILKLLFSPLRVQMWMYFMMHGLSPQDISSLIRLRVYQAFCWPICSGVQVAKHRDASS